MAAGTVISGGFPGRVAQEVTPNQKCKGCLHYDNQAGRTGACLIGLKPFTCGDGGAPMVSYAPIVRGAGSYLPDMSNHGAHAPEVDAHAVGGLYGSGSTRPVEIKQVSLGEEHVHFVKSLIARHTEFQKSQCRRCSMRGSHGMAPPNVEPQDCTCAPITVKSVARALVSRMTNAQLASTSIEDVVQWVRGVVDSGFRLPVAKSSGQDLVDVDVDHSDLLGNNGGHLRLIEKGSHFLPTGEYKVTPAGGGEHHVDFHPRDGGSPTRLPGKFSSPKAARRAAIDHSERFAAGSARQGPTIEAKTRANKVKGGDTDGVSKGFYSDDWITQFKGTPLFASAREICEQELALEEAQLKLREARAKRDKKQREVLKRDAVPDDDWQKQENRRERIRIAKQRLVLKLATHQQKAMAKGDEITVEKSFTKLGSRAVHLTGVAHSTEGRASHENALAAHKKAAAEGGPKASFHEQHVAYHQSVLDSMKKSDDPEVPKHLEMIHRFTKSHGLSSVVHDDHVEIHIQRGAETEVFRAHNMKEAREIYEQEVVVAKALHWGDHPTGQKQATTAHGAYRHSENTVHYMPWASPGRLGGAQLLGEHSSTRKLRSLAEDHNKKLTAAKAK